MPDASTKPYLMRAIYEWCVDQSFTPYMTVQVNHLARVPMEFVRDGRITFNISPSAAKGLVMDNHWVRFSARFGGVARNIEVPVETVESLFAREHGQGLSFQIPDTAGDETEDGMAQNLGLSTDETAIQDKAKDGDGTGDDDEPPKPGRAHLHVVK